MGRFNSIAEMNENLKKMIAEKEMTTCESGESAQWWACQTEEQCDDCFMVDHQKECGWCTFYDHTVRKLEVKHL